MAAKGKHALVFGASGLIGWGVVDQLLSNYPAQGTFSTVSALVNRPLRVEDSFWPERSPATPDLQLVSGVNLAGTTIESLEKLLLREVRGIENVTHVFYFGTLCYSSYRFPRSRTRAEILSASTQVGRPT